MTSNPDEPPFIGYVETTVNALRPVRVHAARQGERLTTDSPHMQHDDIQAPDNRQGPSNIVHHIRNLKYEVVYNINSFNTHSFKMQESGNHNNRKSLSSCCSSIISDEARFIRPILTFATSASGTTPWPTSLAKFHSCAGSTGPLVLHFSIFIDHSFILSYLLRHSFAYCALREAYQLKLLTFNSCLLLLAIICKYFSSP